MALINIPTSGLWSSIAASLNSMFSELFNRTGWGFYTDSQYTVGSPFTVAQGVTSNLPNNRNTKIETQLPSDATQFYDGAKLIAVNDGDNYKISVRFKCKSSAQAGSYALKLDIGGSQGIISQVSKNLTKGTNVENFEEIQFSVFSGSTFVANGGTLKVEAITGTLSVYDITYLITRIHKAK